MPDFVALPTQVVPIGRIVRSPFNTRKTFDDAYIKELSVSISEHGVLQPIKVVPAGGNSGRPKTDGFEIVFGECRWRASKQAGLAMMPVMVDEKITDVEIQEQILIENITRKDVDPIEQAEGFRKLLAMPAVNGVKPHTVDSIAQTLGGPSKRNFVYNSLAMLKAAPELIEAAKEGILTPSHLERVARLPQRLQKDFLNDHRDSPFTILETKDWIAENAFKDMRNCPFDRTVANLVKDVQACSACPKFSAVNSEIRAEVGNDHTCTDPSCYMDKTFAHIDLVASKIPKAQLVFLNDSYRHDDEVMKKYKPRGKGDYTPAYGKECPSRRMGVIVMAEGGKDDHLGKLRPVCIDASCKIHHPGDTGAAPAERQESWKKKQAEDEKRRKEERKDKAAIVDAIAAKVTPDMVLRSLLFQAIEVIDFTDWQEMRKTFKIRDYPIEKRWEDLSGLTSKQLQQMARSCAIQGNLDHAKPFANLLAEELKLDPAAIIAKRRGLLPVAGDPPAKGGKAADGKVQTSVTKAVEVKRVGKKLPKAAAGKKAKAVKKARKPLKKKAAK